MITDSDIMEAITDLGARLVLHEFLLEKILVLDSITDKDTPLCFGLF